MNCVRQGEHNRKAIAQFLIEHRGVKYSVQDISDLIGLNAVSVRTHCHKLVKDNPEINLEALRVNGAPRKVHHFFAV